MEAAAELSAKVRAGAAAARNLGGPGIGAVVRARSPPTAPSGPGAGSPRTPLRPPPARSPALPTALGACQRPLAAQRALARASPPGPAIPTPLVPRRARRGPVRPPVGERRVPPPGPGVRAAAPGLLTL